MPGAALRPLRPWWPQPEAAAAAPSRPPSGARCLGGRRNASRAGWRGRVGWGSPTEAPV